MRSSSRTGTPPPGWRSPPRGCRRAPTWRSTRSWPSRALLGHAQPRGLDEAVLTPLDQAAQAIEGVVDVGEPGVERRESEPDRVRAAEVRDHAGPLDQGAADRPGLGVRDADVAAATIGAAGGRGPETQRRGGGGVGIG